MARVRSVGSDTGSRLTLAEAFYGRPELRRYRRAELSFLRWEIARGVLFLVADDAGFITGSTLSINGGQHMY